MHQCIETVLLGVSRARWSMYESGKRRLPPGAVEMIAELPAYAQRNESPVKNPSGNQRMKLFEPGYLQNRLRHARFQHEKTNLALRQLTKTRNWQLNLFRLAHFLDKDSAIDVSVNKMIRTTLGRNPESIESTYLERLVKLQYDLELLNLQITFLESNIEKLG